MEGEMEGEMEGRRVMECVLAGFRPKQVPAEC